MAGAIYLVCDGCGFFYGDIRLYEEQTVDCPECGTTVGFAFGQLDHALDYQARIRAEETVPSRRNTTERDAANERLAFYDAAQTEAEGDGIWKVYHDKVWRSLQFWQERALASDAVVEERDAAVKALTNFAVPMRWLAENHPDAWGALPDEYVVIFRAADELLASLSGTPEAEGAADSGKPFTHGAADYDYMGPT